MKLFLGMGVLALAAFNANATDRLPICLGSQSTNCRMADPAASNGPFVRCSGYKTLTICNGESVDESTCHVEMGDLMCPVPKAAVAPSTYTAEGEGSIGIAFESSAVDACDAGVSIAANQAESMARNQAASGCTAHQMDSSKTTVSFMVHPLGHGDAECVAHATVTCLKE